MSPRTLYSLPLALQCLAALLLLTVPQGCGRSSSDASGSPEAAVRIPEALTSARLAFERNGSILVLVPGSGQPARALARGSRPRWNPEGTWIAYVADQAIHRVKVKTGKSEKLVEAPRARVVAVTKDGEEVWFADDTRLRSVSLATGETRTLLEGPRILEFDIAPDNQSLVATVKRFTGYSVQRIEIDGGNVLTDYGRGCSASLSPNGERVTKNTGDHTRLTLYNAATGEETGVLSAPEGSATDNQFWSNHPEWVVSMQEHTGAILAHRVSDDAVFRLTETGGADRPDLWVP